MRRSHAFRRWLVSPAALLLVLAFAGPAPAQETFQDDFERDDGPVDGWTVFAGPWEIAAGELSTATTDAPGSWIWAGDPPVKPVGDLTLNATVRFGPAPGDAVGRHGGFMFYASEATQRGDPLMNGYTVDWIDRKDVQHNDYGFRLMRVDQGIQTPLLAGTPEFDDVPEEWGVEVEGDTIRLLADGASFFEVVDNTYREGYVGAWTYQNGANILIDEIEFTYVPLELDACFTASTDTGTAPVSVDFDAACTLSVNGVDSYEWDFGDGEVATGAAATHEFLFGGSYMVTLTVQDSKGNTETASLTVEVFDSAATFSDDFSRPDGPVDNWTVFRGDWNIFNEELTTSTAGQENWAWAGDPAFSFPANFTLTFSYAFTATPADAVGRHGGVMFCATKPTWRYDTTISGYTIDWIDRVGDHGIRLIRVDGGAQTVLDIGGSERADPPLDWQIVVEGVEIRVFADGDDTPILTATDSTYRNGFFGCWAYSNGQSLAIDDVDVTSPSVSPCFTVSPEPNVPVGTELTFDAACSSATGTPILSYNWDFGDGATAEGSVVTHTYTAEGVRTVKLALQTEGGLSGETERTVDVFVPVDSFEDDFERPDGPPSGWTITSGDWNLLGGALHIETPIAPESWIWAGDTPVRFGGLTSIEVEVNFLDDAPADPLAVGRHGGIFFFGKTTSPRFQGNSGYTMDWIDRENPTYDDHGFRLSRFDEGVQTTLLQRTEDIEPGTAWRIEIDGDTLRVLVDDVVKAEVVDDTYRVGFFGLWTYQGDELTGFVNAAEFDNVLLASGGGPGKPEFHRGDANGDGAINITDGIFVLNFLFLGGPTPPCREAANPNDDSAINITDGIYILNFLFLGGPDPASPGPVGSPCGPDPAGSPIDLGCDSYTKC